MILIIIVLIIASMFIDVNVYALENYFEEVKPPVTTTDDKNKDKDNKKLSAIDKDKKKLPAINPVVSNKQVNLNPISVSNAISNIINSGLTPEMIKNIDDIEKEEQAKSKNIKIIGYAGDKYIVETDNGVNIYRVLNYETIPNTTCIIIDKQIICSVSKKMEIKQNILNNINTLKTALNIKDDMQSKDSLQAIKQYLKTLQDKKEYYDNKFESFTQQLIEKVLNNEIDNKKQYIELLNKCKLIIVDSQKDNDILVQLVKIDANKKKCIALKEEFNQYLKVKLDMLSIEQQEELVEDSGLKNILDSYYKVFKNTNNQLYDYILWRIIS